MSSPRENAPRPPRAEPPETSELSAIVAARVRDVPDFPRPGVLFKDITPLLADGKAFAAVVDGIVGAHGAFDVAVGVEARGFLIASAVAYAAGVGVVPVRKAGKLPGPSVRASYQLEYGEEVIEMHEDAVRPGERVLVVDDVLATGGTLAATVGLLRRRSAEIAGVSVILELSALGGRARAGHDVHTLLVA